MEVMNSETYLIDRVEDQINWYSTKSQWNQKFYKRLKTAEIIFAALIPFLVNYISANTGYYKAVVGLLGISVTVISGILSLFRFQENWIDYRATAESLKHEKFLFLTRAEPYNVENPYLLLVQRTERLISQENTKWSYYMTTKGKEEKNDLHQ